jgi:hypothetical protein
MRRGENEKGRKFVKFVLIRVIGNSVKPFLGSIQWSNGVDLCPDTLYLESH